ncbi:hypothetical protein SORDD16_01567 [Streptococcus oralis]|uniref:Uncharacterized protein n=1 Tax=Streptococcus oralis TaxID=1303 RepID=A0A139PAG2_STROR|nr:hypothetical protein SORDD16_01567 [Streptococcus oralis]
MSTVAGDLWLTSREDQIGSLFYDVQSDQNFRFKVFEVSKNLYSQHHNVLKIRRM